MKWEEKSESFLSMKQHLKNYLELQSSPLILKQWVARLPTLILNKEQVKVKNPFYMIRRGSTLNPYYFIL